MFLAFCLFLPLFLIRYSPKGWVLDQHSIFVRVDCFVQRFRELLEVTSLTVAYKDINTFGTTPVHTTIISILNPAERYLQTQRLLALVLLCSQNTLFNC